MEATGVSFAEQQMRRGRYYDQPPFPFVPGYDLVGTVMTTGDGVAPALIGTRVAALLNVGGWASHVVVDAADVVPVPDGIGAAQAETVVINGITAWQMLHRKARVRAGQTVLVHGANGGVGSVLVQLAHAAGAKVMGTASARHHAALRERGVTPIDYRTENTPARVRELATGGVDAVFDHVGGRSVVDSWRLLAPGGTLVSYGSASTRDDAGYKQWPVLKLLGRIWVWNALPNRRQCAAIRAACARSPACSSARAAARCSARAAAGEIRQSTSSRTRSCAKRYERPAPPVCTAVSTPECQAAASARATRVSSDSGRTAASWAASSCSPSTAAACRTSRCPSVRCASSPLTTPPMSPACARSAATSSGSPPVRRYDSAASGSPT
ncbi:zinc-binding dehydrogenase [Streptomyces actuosus]|uniref:NADPH:quinone reductase n=1 Tax=Streptomyces actuosus TaxID=1885 RepID=A0A2U9NUH7_STRAS|nr:NADPH:quinone reductase [Streptomyces actuosus]MBM4826608.1 zinc-binding dehydrogenase [Streptomyces actuosus]